MSSLDNKREPTELLRQLPSVHELLNLDELANAIGTYGRDIVSEHVRLCIDELRTHIRDGHLSSNIPPLETLASQVAATLDLRSNSRLRRVINATGILLHTGLGRAPLPDSVTQALLDAVGYCNVEIDLETGDRTKRHQLVENDLCALTGAEAALVVNNNAGATGLVLAAFASGREAIVSHGQLIEIGGGFRLPDVFRAYGAELRAVGTTNRTRVKDFAEAINDRTGAMMLIHTSNYRVVGFTEEPSLDNLVELGKGHDFPVIHDLGSGALFDALEQPTSKEPLVGDSVRHGAGLVLFSGDKLLGGPQAGIIVGKRRFVEQLARHPMSRALRVDKLTLAALQATLAIYRRALSDSNAYDEIPLLRMMRTPTEQIEQRAKQLAEQLGGESNGWEVRAKPSYAYAGGGSLPGTQIDSWAVTLEPATDAQSVDRLAHRLRTCKTPVVGRIHQDMLHLDLRGVDPTDDSMLATAVQSVILESRQLH